MFRLFQSKPVLASVFAIHSLVFNFSPAYAEIQDEKSGLFQSYKILDMAVGDAKEEAVRKLEEFYKRKIKLNDVEMTLSHPDYPGVYEKSYTQDLKSRTNIFDPEMMKDSVIITLSVEEPQKVLEIVRRIEFKNLGIKITPEQFIKQILDQYGEPSYLNRIGAGGEIYYAYFDNKQYFTERVEYNFPCSDTFEIIPYKYQEKRKENKCDLFLKISFNADAYMTNVDYRVGSPSLALSLAKKIDEDVRKAIEKPIENAPKIEF